MKRFKRGAALGYVIALMLVIAAFTALILTVATLGVNMAGTHSDYLERKQYLHEIGKLSYDIYVTGDGTEELTIPVDNEYGFTVTVNTAEADNTVTITVNTASGGTALTIIYTQQSDGTAYELERYVYGAFGSQ